MRISCIKVFKVGAVMAVRRRFMKAVFFLSEESSDLLTWNTSDVNVSFAPMGRYGGEGGQTLIARPGSRIELTQLS